MARLVILLGVIAAGILLWWLYTDRPAAVTENNNGVSCIQVITPARNPETGEVKEFSTPCDIPEGWEQVDTSSSQ